MVRRRRHRWRRRRRRCTGYKRGSAVEQQCSDAAWEGHL
jgi:hypothetical protein